MRLVGKAIGVCYLRQRLSAADVLSVFAAVAASIVVGIAVVVAAAAVAAAAAATAAAAAALILLPAACRNISRGVQRAKKACD